MGDRLIIIANLMLKYGSCHPESFSGRAKGLEGPVAIGPPVHQVPYPTGFSYVSRLKNPHTGLADEGYEALDRLWDFN